MAETTNAATGSGALNCQRCSDSLEHTWKPRHPAAIAHVRGQRQNRIVCVAGRDAWALRQLMAAGEDGWTPLHNPAPRLSHYVFKLRRAGIDVETIRESHDGSLPRQHAHYVLRSQVSIDSEGAT